MLAEAHNWTPEQVDRCDPAFVDELLIQKEARSDHELLNEDDAKARDAKLRRRRTQRKVEIVKRYRRGNS